jgi:potassium intermediate/small conductance calcium-activated channel subfamily N protein 2
VVCLFGSFVMSLMVVTLTNSLTTTSLEGKAIAVLERLQAREQLIHEAATIITLMSKVGLKWKLTIQLIVRKGTLT